jgi:hypothetical protein
MLHKRSLYLYPCVASVTFVVAGHFEATSFGRVVGHLPSWTIGPKNPGDLLEGRPPQVDEDEDSLYWHGSYAKAYATAKSKRRLLLINFVPRDANRNQQELEAAIASRDPWQSKLRKFVLCRVPVESEIQVRGEPVRLLSHGAFGEMHNRPGIAVVDLANVGKSYYGHVVSALPFMHGKYYRWRTDHFSAVLDLPPGTITQRSMIWAVRTHPERPASTDGAQDAALADAAKSHSQHQASIGVQGHHNWEGRFHRLRRLLGGGLPVEVVAESWPGQTMIDSCVDCVASWRQSSGHWSAVRSAQSRFGYDIRRGPNGIWYGTGIFLR